MLLRYEDDFEIDSADGNERRSIRAIDWIVDDPKDGPVSSRSGARDGGSRKGDNVEFSPCEFLIG